MKFKECFQTSLLKAFKSKHSEASLLIKPVFFSEQLSISISGGGLLTFCGCLPNNSVTQISRIYIHYVLFLVDQAKHATSQELTPITQVPHPSLPLTQIACHPCGCLGECWGLPTLNIGPQPMHLTEHHHAWLEVTLRGLDFPSVDYYKRTWRHSAHMTTLTSPLLRVTLPMQPNGRGGGWRISALEMHTS